MVHGWEQKLVLQQHARQRRSRERRGREHHELDDAEWRLALAIGATVVAGMLGGEQAAGGGGGGGGGGGSGCVGERVHKSGKSV